MDVSRSSACLKVVALTPLLGDTTSQALGFTGILALTSTPYASPWPGCSPYTCYLTPELVSMARWSMIR